MNRDLFLAILSMDSYNRGYARSIKFKKDETPDPKNENGSRIGNANIILQSDVDEGEPGTAAGFYALAYDVSQIKDEAGNPLFGTNGTVISYRGTDGLSDFWAYGIGAGQPFSLTGGLTDQARLTVEFYRAVAGENVDPFAANIITTGHSLGGGLAGFVAGYEDLPGTAEAIAANDNRVSRPLFTIGLVA